jgi:hypothetical protein
MRIESCAANRLMRRGIRACRANRVKARPAGPGSRMHGANACHVRAGVNRRDSRERPALYSPAHGEGTSDV